MFDIRVKKSLGRFHLSADIKAEAGLTALFGPSGAGKTLLAKMLAGLVTPDEGHIELAGRTLFSSAKNINIPVHQRHIGFVFQEHRLFPHYSVRGNLTYGNGRRAGKATPVSFEKVADILGLAALLDREPASLSGGERQRVAIGRALLSNPKILILDEPLSSLDDARKREILPLIEALKSEFDIPTLYISHSIEEITRLADTLLLLDNGAMKAVGPTADILTRLDLIPYAGGYDAGTLIAATVTAYEPAHHMLTLETAGGGKLYITGGAKEIGSSARLRIRARDVALSKTEPKSMSILNRFKGRLVDHCSGAEGMEELLLDVGFPLTARITRKSFEDMKLTKDTPVWALVKAVTISRA
ncbi:molybdenum ABC transporter ATP-binding protein [Sneathiella sp. CAU 1612]|uniref:Molybdenum ABC transporter ATP-binding protein n=1 Tax=Sneathiella sedimenti TaxID=2816034 RepID=A0ABS3F7P6_9PROT|nr:molybdenum ABC transporter ATP-binding protein [Sneathiella sedimenti]MBO0334552.1 molybdenum ABC transporter ATP-binding protein [Sneathiella sedimenti]